MKKLFMFALVALMCLAVLPSCSAPDNGPLKIGYTLYPPMNYKDDAGNLIGFDTEFAQAVCKELGYTPEFQLITWGQKYMELNSGNIDCIWNGFTFNCADDDGIQRSDKVDFSYAYMNNEQCVVVRSANLATLNTKEALAGKTCSVEKDSAGEGAAKALMGENGEMVTKTSQMDAFTELKSGNVDFIVVDKTLAKSIVGKGDYADLAMADGIQIESEQYAIGFKKGSELTEKVNGAIKKLSEDGTLKKLAEKYGLTNYLLTEFK